jgi:hypothetical protein
MKEPYEWPSRERWAEQYQRPSWDGETGCPYDHNYSHQLSDFATSEEVAALTTALKDLYRELGRKLQARKPSHQTVRSAATRRRTASLVSPLPSIACGRPGAVH